MAVYKVSAAEDYSLTLGQKSKLESVLQNVALLLNTKQGTAPLHREYGLPMAFVDKPIDVAETIAFAEISEALEKFEPRAVLKDLWFEKNEKGEMSVVVEVIVDVERI